MYFFLCLEYVNKILEVLPATPRKELQVFTKRHASAQPKPLNSQFENKIGKEEALKKAKERRSMSSIQLFPPGTVTHKFKKIYHFWVHFSYFSHCILVSEQMDLQKNVNASTDASRPPLRAPRKTPTCRTCGEPMKGH